MPARRSTKKRSVPQSSRRETILYPLVMEGERHDRPKLSETQLSELEKSGRISLTPDARRYVENIARSWTAHERARYSPRPGQFRARLRSIRANLEKAHAEADLNREGATFFDRHLLLWILERPEIRDLLIQFASLEHLIGSILKAEQMLPPDSGAARPREDHRFIQYLADQFQACGGKPRAYLDAYSDEGYRQTPFRQFVHQFYGFLSLEAPRTPRGLDEAIRKALAEWRRTRKV